MSQKRMKRYVTACNGDTRKAMTLYRYNLQISQEMFTIISCFEVALRNAIDNCLKNTFGPSWLKDSISPNGFLTNKNTIKTYEIITHAYNKLVRDGIYSHDKLLSGLEFGIWKYMYSPVQFRATKQVLLQIFPKYHKIQTLFSWMGIDSRAMLYGLDHVLLVCKRIDELKT